jgi:hypothetical protein
VPTDLAREVELAKNMTELSPVFVLQTEPEIDAKEPLMRRESRSVPSSIL